jgi:DNA repair protein RadA/Sms
MQKSKVSYTCTECGALSPKWSGQCADCEAWNSLTEIAMTAKSPATNQNPVLKAMRG